MLVGARWLLVHSAGRRRCHTPCVGCFPWRTRVRSGGTLHRFGLVVHSASTGLCPAETGVVPLPIPRADGGEWSGHELHRRRASILPPLRGRTGPSPQPPGRGVAARGDAAVEGRHRHRVRGPRRRGLLQAGPRPHLRGHHLAVGRRRARRPGHRGRGAAPRRPARRRRRPGHARHPPGQHPGHLQRRPLRPHHRGARPAAAPHRRRRRDRRDELRPARGRHQDRRPGRVAGVRGRPAPRHRHHGADPRPARRQPRPARVALRQGRRHHRHAHRLPRPRRAALGPAAQRPLRARRPPLDGQDRPRPRRGLQRRHRGPAARC